MQLAALTENAVEVVITLERDQASDFFLAATFTPTQAGFHLYSKDTPLEGVNGVGRPTRLELTPQSQMKPLGDLLESVAPLAEPVAAGQPGLWVYPEGPVTLRLPVALPEADCESTPDQVSVTYMACSAQGCKKPVVGKAIAVSVPCASAAAAK